MNPQIARYAEQKGLVMLGINTEFKPRFLRQYLNLNELATAAVQKYIADIKSKDFPNNKTPCAPCSNFFYIDPINVKI